MRAARNDLQDVQEQKAVLDQERQSSTTMRQQLEAELAAIDRPIKEAEHNHALKVRELDLYHTNVKAAQELGSACPTEIPFETAENAIDIVDSLGKYIPEPERDAALKVLEKCRAKLLRIARANINDTVIDLRAEFAIEIEDLFDEANPYNRGDLTATVSGVNLDVRMQGNFEGRARHSQEQVDMWCIEAGGLFKKITLKNSHGTFSCTSTTKPADLMASVLEKAGLTNSWFVSGDEATPVMPEPLPPPPPLTTQRRQQLASELDALDASVVTFEARQARIIEQEADAEQTIVRVDQKYEQRVQDWGDLKIARAGRVQIVGVIFTVIGGAFVLGTVGALQSGAEGAKRFLPIGIGVGLTFAVLGGTMIIGGSLRKKRVREQLAN